MENFGEIYNQRYLEEKIKEITGKTIEEIEIDWHNYVIENAPPITDYIRSKTNFSYYNDYINQIDSSLLESKEYTKEFVEK